MKPFSYLVGLLLGFCLASSSLAAAEYLKSPSDPRASEATRNVYDYLRTRRGQTENRVLEGQFLGTTNQVLHPGKKFYGFFDINQHAIDGKLPALAGSRYDGDDKETGEYLLNAELVGKVNEKLIATWNRAHPIIHLTASPRNPWNQARGREPDEPKMQSIARLLRSATNLTPAQQAVRAKFWADIDVIAAGLQQLEKAGIPVLFRPFAEFNTNKYYSVKQSSADFVALWKEVYHTYTDEPPAGKGLHNLLFCWEAWALNRKDTTAAIAAWYPGNDTVDVVAGGYYFKPDTPQSYYLDPVSGRFSFAHSNPNDLRVYNWLINQARPFGAAQYGLNQGTNVPGDHEFTRRFMDFSPDLAFVFYWNQVQAVERQAHAREFVADPRVATHDDLPNFERSSAARNPVR